MKIDGENNKRDDGSSDDGVSTKLESIMGGTNDGLETTKVVHILQNGGLRGKVLNFKHYAS